MSLDDIASVSISTTSAQPTRVGFGTGLVAAHHTRYVDRVRSYTSLAGLVADGFTPRSAVYRAVAAIFSQNPRPPRVKVGRRASPFTQVVRVVPTAPASPTIAETYSLEVDGFDVTFITDATPTLAEVCTGLATAINALADDDAILATGGASALTSQNLTGTAINGAIGRDIMSPPRALTITVDDHADWSATTVTITGTNDNGTTVNDTFAIPDRDGTGGNLTILGALGTHFKTVTTIAVPAQAGTGGTFTVGVRAPVTAVGSSGTHVVCTAPVAGELHAYEPVTANIGLTDTTTDPGIAADLAAILAADPDWYGLLLDSNSEAEAMAAAAWTETADKLLVVQSADLGCAVVGTTDDLLSELKAASFARTVGVFYPAIAADLGWLAAGLLGNRLPVDPGSDTWAFKVIAGVTARSVTDTQRGTILGKNGTLLEVVSGVAFTVGGKVAGGEWADVVRGLDWWSTRMKERILAVKLANEKIAYTDEGIGLIGAEVRGQLDEGVGVSLFAADPKPTVIVPTAASTTSGDRAARVLNGVTFTARLAGAIHATNITGVASV